MPRNLAFGEINVNSPWRIYLFSVLLLNFAMDIDDIRRANICLLEKSAKSPTAVAEKVGMSYAQYVNLRDGAIDQRNGKQRGMRKETAWRFEDAFGMPRGWLDTRHDTPADSAAEPMPRPYVHPNETLRQIIALCEATDEAGRGMALMAVQQALERYRPSRQSVA